MGKEEIIRSLLSAPRKAYKRNPHTEETKKKISSALKGRPLSEEHKQKLKKPKKWTPAGKEACSKSSSLRKNNLGKKWTSEQKRRMSEGAKNKVKMECPHCHKVMDASNAKKYHFDRCKQS